MEQYEVKVFYDPRRIGIQLLQKFYKVYGLKSPKSEEELRTPFHRDASKDLEVAVTDYKPLTLDQAMELSRAVLGFPKTRAEISHS